MIWLVASSKAAAANRGPLLAILGQPSGLFRRWHRQAAFRPQSLHLDAQRSFHLKEFRPLLAGEQRRRHAMLPGAPRPPNTVNEILRDLRQIEIDQMRDVF